MSTFVSATQLTAQVPAAEITAPGTAQVSVSNPPSTSSTPVDFVTDPGPPGVIQTISAVGGAADAPALSATGRFVAFTSFAHNVIIPNTQFPEVYVRDTCLGVANCTPSTQLVSAITGGFLEGNGGSVGPSISKQGRFVGFNSYATNLVTPNTTRTRGFMRDTCAGAQGNCSPTTVLATIGLSPIDDVGGFEIANDSCNATFEVGEANPGGISDGLVLTSCSANGPAGGFTSASSFFGAGPPRSGESLSTINSDGRFITFSGITYSINDSNTMYQSIYLHDTCTGAPSGCTPTTTILNSFGPFFSNTSGLSPSISADGRFVVFATGKALPGMPAAGKSGIFLSDTCNSSSGPVTGCTPSLTTIVETDGTDAVAHLSQHAISNDGRFVIFDSSATNLVTPATSGDDLVFVYDTCNSSGGMASGCTPRTVLISVDSNGNQLSGDNFASISGDGHFAAWWQELVVPQLVLAATGF